jgi:hypothetical protein
MTNTITISVSAEDYQFLDENPELSPTRMFRDAIYLIKRLNSISEIEEFENLMQILPYITRLQNNILRLQKEILVRSDAVDSLSNVIQLKQENKL